MSLLKNVLRTVWDSRSPAGVVPAPAEEAGAAAGGGGPAAAAADTPPAWRSLEAQAGVQDVDYGDIARPGVQRLFRRPPRRLLDIGCASGAVGAGLKADLPGLWAWGCELNARAAEVAATRLDHVTSVPRSEWPATDLALLASVDTVLMLDVLEHMVNPWAELEFLAHRLPSDAQVIVSLPNAGHLSVLDELSRGSFQYRPTGILDVTHVRFFTFATMCAMFEQTGYAIEDTWILSSTAQGTIEHFPARVRAGNATLDVANAQEWERLHAIQFGFRLKPLRESPAGA